MEDADPFLSPLPSPLPPPLLVLPFCFGVTSGAGPTLEGGERATAGAETGEDRTEAKEELEEAPRA